MPAAYDEIKTMVYKAAALAGALLEQWSATPAAPEADLVYETEQARREWQLARSYFDTVTDPDLIDFAIYNLKAAERRYTYLLKQVRQGTGEMVENEKHIRFPFTV